MPATTNAASLGKALLGCIADDFTGACDLASNLVSAGFRVMLTIGVPESPLAESVDAVVIALKTRTAPADDAVRQSLAALAWLQNQGAGQIYFKYCSTFDSSPAGNIGPVTEALMDALGADFTVACPAFPDNGRTVFKGYLFAGDVLLHESSMRHHPLTPMADSSLVRVMQAQTRRRVGLIDYRILAEGSAAIAQQMATLKNKGISIAILDATSNADLHLLGQALADLPLLTAASGLAMGLRPPSGMHTDAARLPPAKGFKAIVSGSCSAVSNAQVADFIGKGGAAFAVDAMALAAGQNLVLQALEWASTRLQSVPVLIYATAAPKTLAQVQASLGASKAGEMVEAVLAAIATGLVQRGVGQLVVAGGETSGACVLALGIQNMRVGPQIAPGVPWCHAHTAHSDASGIHIALKSGNFGDTDFFDKAFALIE